MHAASWGDGVQSLVDAKTTLQHRVVNRKGDVQASNRLAAVGTRHEKRNCGFTNLSRLKCATTPSTLKFLSAKSFFEEEEVKKEISGEGEKLRIHGFLPTKRTRGEDLPPISP